MLKLSLSGKVDLKNIMQSKGWYAVDDTTGLAALVSNKKTAVLLSAAPDLLEACKELDDAWTGGEEGDWRGALDHALSLARAAIAKAEKA